MIYHGMKKLHNEYVDLFEKYGFLIDIKIGLESVFKVFKHEKIYENKIDNSMNDAEAARAEEAEIIRLAHIPDVD